MQETDAEELVYGNVRVNLANFTVYIGGDIAELTYFEFELLVVLCRDAGRISGYDALCESLWQSTGSAERRRLSVAIFRLRNKLEKSWPYRIETVRGRGYGLIASRSP